MKEKEINLSTVKIQKILITGGYWSTARGREIMQRYDSYNKPGVDKAWIIRTIAKELEVSVATVDMYLPYEKVVYGLERKSRNAKKCAEYRKRRKKADDKL